MFSSPSSSQGRGVGVPRPSRTPTRRLSAMKTTPDRPEEYRRSSGDVDDDDSSQSLSIDVEEPAAVGTKRSRDRDDDNDDERALVSDYEERHNDTVSAIVLRAKRLRINDNAAEDRDREVHQMRTKVEEKGEIIHDIASVETRVLVKPSLGGLPEELVIEIALDLDLFDVMALRRVNRRLSSITRARIVWITHLSSLLAQLQLPKSPATFLPSLLSSAALERIVLRSLIFDHKWFHSLTNHHNPVSSQVLSAGWSAPRDIRFPFLLPGGRWLIAVCDDERSFNNAICLWDLDHGKLKWLPEAQMEAEGRVLSMDVKMDQSGLFAFLVVLSQKVNVAMTLVSRVDVYCICLLVNTDVFGFGYMDTLSLNDRRASEVQIYPQFGEVLVDLFDRVLIWAFSPENKCAWIVTSETRHHGRRFSHRSPHAITRTHTSILVADGDEHVLRAFHIPPLLNRPAQLSALLLHIAPPYLEYRLPSFSVSLRFSTDRLVDVTPTLKAQNEACLDGTGIAANAAQAGPSVAQTEEQTETEAPCPDPSGRGVLFIDAPSCSSYLICSYPIHNISLFLGSPDSLIWTSMDRGDAHEQIRRGDPESNPGTPIDIQARIARARPFYVPTHASPRVNHGCAGEALWIGTLGQFSASLAANCGRPRSGVRNVVLMRDPNDPGGLTILSALVPPPADVGPGQAVMFSVEQGQARTVLGQSVSDNAESKVVRHGRVEEATVDQISGRVCIVETTTTIDPTSSKTEYRCSLRLLEYA